MSTRFQHREQGMVMMLPCERSGIQVLDRHYNKGLQGRLSATTPECLPSVYLTSLHMTTFPGLPLHICMHTASNQRLKMETAWEGGYAIRHTPSQWIENRY